MTYRTGQHGFFARNRRIFSGLLSAFSLKSQFFAAAFASATLAVSAGSTNDVLEAESDIEMPKIEASVNYRTSKIEYGMVENDESVFGYEVEIEWYGLFGGFEACHDLTDVNERRGLFNEIESFLGYGFKWDDFSAKAAYVYKSVFDDDESDTQEVELELEYETPWVTPFVTLVCDTRERPGALYGVAGISREWELCDRVSLVTVGDVGFGNPYHNDWCFERGRWAFREMHLGAELEIEICPHVKLVPSIDFYDYFTEAQRNAYDKFNGFVAVAGCRLAVEF